MNNTGTLTTPGSKGAATGPAPQRISVGDVAPDLYKAQLGLEAAVRKSGIEPTLYELVFEFDNGLPWTQQS